MNSAIQIKEAGTEDIPAIIEIAMATWWHTYEPLIGKEQVDYMFGQIYTPESLERQLNFWKHKFLLMTEGEHNIAYAAFSPRAEDDSIVKLHKLYLIPGLQGRGLGKQLIQEVETQIKAEGRNIVELNVNRDNKALLFYQLMGFVIVKEEDIPIGPYWMNDYLMRKEL